MDNTEKAKAAYKLSEEIKEHDCNVKELKVRLKKHTEEGEKATITLDCWQNWGVKIEANKELIEILIASEEENLAKAENELDQLLNGDVKKLKACLEGLGSEQ